MPPPHLPPIPPPWEFLGVEFVYFLLVTGICLLIYSKTREIYSLTKHEGIYHFRNIFLYFALAYFFRLFHVGIPLSRELFGFEMPLIVHPVSLVLVSYFSTLAILSLAMTVAIRYMKRTDHMPYVMHVVALCLALLVFLTRSHFLLMILQTSLVVLSVIVALLHSSKGFFSQNRMTYFFLFIVWMINVLVFSRHLVPPFLKIPLYVVSLVVFLSILYRINKRLYVKKT